MKVTEKMTWAAAGLLLRHCEVSLGHIRAALEAALAAAPEPAWVEELAAEYEERARLREELASEARAADRNQNAADLAMWASHYRNLAAELRARTKQGGERE